MQPTSMVAVVAGGSGDIGSAIARELLATGYVVASGDSRPAPPDLAENNSFYCSNLDLTDPQAVDIWLTDITERIGDINVLVAAIGSVRSGRLVDLNPSQWHADLASLLDAPFLVATSTIRRMLDVRTNQPRRIVFIGSWAADAPHPQIGAYSIAKAGQRALMRTLALDHAPDNILINEVAPGLVDAGLSKQLFRQQDGLADRTREQIPVRRLTDPREIALVVRALCDERMTSTTGSVLTMDGGMSLTSALIAAEGAASKGESTHDG